MVACTAKQALIFDITCPLPCEESVPSVRESKGQPYIRLGITSPEDRGDSPSFSTMMVGVCPPNDMTAGGRVEQGLSSAGTGE